MSSALIGSTVSSELQIGPSGLETEDLEQASSVFLCMSSPEPASKNCTLIANARAKRPWTHPGDSELSTSDGPPTPYRTRLAPLRQHF